ncbi:MAG: hypothetical protein ACJ76I_16470 [Gaiellaceae bacterium]
MGRAASIAAAALIAAGATATGVTASPSPSTLRADVAEWSIVPSQGSLRAGAVRIVVRNLGAETHQLMIVRTRSFGQSLTLRGNQAVAQPLASVLAAPGAQKSFTVHLERGSYALLDNLPWHYWKGTQAAFVAR